MSDSLTPWTAAYQASLSITNSQSLFKLMSIELVMPSNCLILCCPLPLLPSIFPSIKVLSIESVLLISWPKYWSFSFSISPSKNIQGWFPLVLTVSLKSKGLHNYNKEFKKRYRWTHHSNIPWLISSSFLCLSFVMHWTLVWQWKIQS